MTATADRPPSIDAVPVPPDGGLELWHAGRERWIELAAQFEDHNYRHCWDYAAMLADRAGATAENVVVAREGVPLALASVRVKRLRGACTGIAYVSGGPLVRHRSGLGARAALEPALAALKAEYVGRRRLVLRVAPPIGDEGWNGVQDECLVAAGLARAQHLRPYRTIVVDIARPLTEVRGGFAQKWRNHLNNAERRSLHVTAGRDPRLFEDFAPLFDELVARKAIGVDLGADFYARLQPRLPDRERLHVAIAHVDGRPAAGVVVSMHGDTAVYLLGAANDAARRTNAAYLLQWRAIEAAARAGCRWYDLGGIDPEGNPSVHHFKQRMGGAERYAPGPYELGPGRVREAAVRAAERVFRAVAARRRPSA